MRRSFAFTRYSIDDHAQADALLTVTPDSVAAAPTMAYKPGITQSMSSPHAANMLELGFLR